MLNNKGPEQRNKGSHERISPTAWTVAYRRTFTDIPYSNEIFVELEKQLKEQGGVEIADELRTPAIAPQSEARFKLVNRLLKQSGSNQVFEIAAGLSPRGLATTDNPSTTYIEVDLPGMMKLKRKIVEAITGKQTVGKRNNLHLETGDALNLQSLQEAASHLDRTRPIVVINEGLLRYLNFDEKAIVARNIHALLEQFSGVWITPDITLPHILNAENLVAHNQTQKIKELTRIDIDQNRFSSVEQARRFFENLGFTVEDHSFMEVVDELVSPKRLGQTDKETEALIEDAHVFVMRLAS